jgi:HEAT repeat protein
MTGKALRSTARSRLLLPALALAAWAGLMAGCSASVADTPGAPPAISEAVWAKANQVITSALADQDPRLRAGAIEVVASTRQLRFAPALRRLTRDPVMPVRFAAILGVGDLQYAIAGPDAKQIFDEPQEDANVRLAAAYALCRLGSPEYRDVLRKGVSDRNQTLRANAVLLLGKLKDSQALDSLYWALQDKDSDEQVVAQAGESIAQLGDSRIYQRLWGKLISVYADDRIAGVRAMGALGTEQARAAITTMLNDSVVEVRLTAAEQLGRLHDAAGAPKVLEALANGPSRDSSPQGGGVPSASRVLAALAIGEIGSGPLVKHLPRLLDDKSRFVQVAAAKAVLMQRGKVAQ